MHGRISTFQINKGIHVEGNGTTLDIVVRAVGGSPTFRSALLEIIENGTSRLLPVFYNEPSQKIMPGIEVTVAGHGKANGNRVVLSYYFAEGLTPQYQKYPENGCVSCPKLPLPSLNSEK